MEIITNTDVAIKAAEKMGLTSRYDEELKRENFPSDDAYLDARTKRELERSTPEYREIRRKLEAELTLEKQKEEARIFNEKRAEYRKNARIAGFESENIQKEAFDRAERDLANNKISRAEFAKTVKKYGDEMEERLRDHKAECASMNDLIRRSAGRK